MDRLSSAVEQVRSVYMLVQDSANKFIENEIGEYDRYKVDWGRSSCFSKLNSINSWSYKVPLIIETTLANRRDSVCSDSVTIRCVLGGDNFAAIGDVLIPKLSTPGTVHANIHSKMLDSISQSVRNWCYSLITPLINNEVDSIKYFGVELIRMYSDDKNVVLFVNEKDFASVGYIVYEKLNDGGVYCIPENNKEYKMVIDRVMSLF